MEISRLNSVELFIKELADRNIVRFSEAGHAIAGNNGPYRFMDTPVRNTAHWLVIYSYLWKVYNDDVYRVIALQFAEYLVLKQEESTSGAIECMVGERFDHLNGLIGQAWVVEALVYSAKTFSENKYYQCAKKIYLSQQFDSSTKLWKRVELDGNVLDYDYTTNHQVWFAIAGLLLNDYESDKRIEEQVNSFFDELEKKHFRIYKNGLIKHHLNIELPKKKTTSTLIKVLIKDLLIPLKRMYPNKYDSKNQEKGYQLFELYGYAVVSLYKKDYSLFTKKEFQKALEYGLDIDNLNRMFNIKKVNKNNKINLERLNRFSYGYNSPAFEYPLIYSVFKHKIDEYEVTSLLDVQKKITYDESAGLLSNNNYDAETLTARIYELVRYCELK